MPLNRMLACREGVTLGAGRLAWGTLGLVLTGKGGGLDLDHRMRRAPAKWLDAIAPGLKLKLTDNLAVVDDKIAALARGATLGRTGEEQDATRPRLRAQRAGDRVAAR